MAMDICSADYQIARINKQIATVKAYSTKIAAYKNNLNRSWSGPEIKLLNCSIDGIANMCRTLENSMEELRKDIGEAMEQAFEEKDTAIIFLESHEV